MTTKQSKGGKARAMNLTPERRKEIAKKAASARWGVDNTAMLASVLGAEPDMTTARRSLPAERMPEND